MKKYTLVGFFFETGDTGVPYHEVWTVVEMQNGFIDRNIIDDAINNDPVEPLGLDDDEEHEDIVERIMNECGYSWGFYIRTEMIESVQVFYL